MNADVIVELFLILLCMYFAYKWKQEKLRSEHFRDLLKDKVSLLQTYKHLVMRDMKKSTRMQNELNRVGNLYLKLKKEFEKNA